MARMVSRAAIGAGEGFGGIIGEDDVRHTFEEVGIGRKPCGIGAVEA
jgi:hypothetical protein